MTFVRFLYTRFALLQNHRHEGLAGQGFRCLGGNVQAESSVRLVFVFNVKEGVATIFIRQGNQIHASARFPPRTSFTTLLNDFPITDQLLRVFILIFDIQIPDALLPPVGKGCFACLPRQGSFLRIKDGRFKIDGWGTAVFTEMILFPDGMPGLFAFIPERQTAESAGFFIPGVFGGTQRTYPGSAL